MASRRTHQVGRFVRKLVRLSFAPGSPLSRGRPGVASTRQPLYAQLARQAAKMGDEAGRRTVELRRAGARVRYDRGELRGELLAQLDAPLVERVDVPDRGFREHLVLVERDQAAQHARGQLAVKEGRG